MLSILRGRDHSAPRFGGSYAYAQCLCLLTHTRLDLERRNSAWYHICGLGRGIFGGQPLHCIMHKCIAWLINRRRGFCIDN